LLLSFVLAGSALAQTPPPPVPPVAPVAPLPPLPPLPPMSPPPGQKQSAELAVKGAVTLRLHAMSTDIEVVKGGAKLVKAQLVDGMGGVELVDRGDHVDLAFGKPTLEGLPGGKHIHLPAGVDGKLHVEVPAGSNVEISTTASDIRIVDVGGSVRARTTAGDLHVKNATAVEATLVSGDVDLEDIRGDVHLRTVSGDAKVVQTGGPASKLEFGSSHGDLHWSGACGAGCRIDARNVSGDVKLNLAPSSSFDLRFVSHGGDLADHLNAQVLESSPSVTGTNVRARVGKGEGAVTVQTFGGDLELDKR
jgi:hypothetical protein